MTFPLHTNVVVVAADNDTFAASVKGMVPFVLDTLTMKHIEVAHHSLLTLVYYHGRGVCQLFYFVFEIISRW